MTRFPVAWKAITTASASVADWLSDDAVSAAPIDVIHGDHSVLEVIRRD